MKKLLSSLIPKKVVALFIARETVDLLVMLHTIKGPKLIKFAQTPIFPKEEPIAMRTKEESILNAINKTLRENKIRPGEALTALPAEEVMVRYFQMPKIPKQEWESAVSFEAKRYIPFRMEDVIYDFKVSESRISPNQMDVVFVAVKREILNSHILLLQKANLRPVVVEPATFSLMRVFRTSEQLNPKEIIAIVDIDSEVANINILRFGIPYLIRDISLGAGFSKTAPQEPIFEKLLAEIKLSFDFYEKQFPAESVEKIILYSKIPLEKWGELAGKELQIPVEVGDPQMGIKTKKGLVPPGVAVAFGLALRGVSEPLIDINLFKERKEFFKKKESFLKLALAEASLAIFILIILRVVLFRNLVPLINELDRLNKERPKVEIKIASGTLSDLERFKAEFENKKRFLKAVIESRSFFTPRINELPSIVPENIWLSELIYEERAKKGEPAKSDKSLNLKGYILADPNSSDVELANKFMAGLRQSGIFSKGLERAELVSVKKTEIDGTKVVSFEMSFK